MLIYDLGEVINRGGDEGGNNGGGRQLIEGEGMEGGIIKRG